MPTIDLPLGRIEYRAFDPETPETPETPDTLRTIPTAVFVHGFLAAGSLWHPVAERLAAQGVRSIVAEWPLGSHRLPVPPESDLGPHPVATAIVDLLAALDLHDVVLVGNDTGGGLCQLALDKPGNERIGGLVLTNCDGFERFPPPFFVPLFVLASSRPAGWALVQTTRVRALRHGPLAYGQLLNHPLPADLTRSWVEPAIRRDIRRFTRSMTRKELLDAGAWLTRFERPTRLVWGTRDRHFSLSLAQRLAEALHAELVEVPDATTFVSIDRPDAVAEGIVAVARRIGSASAA